MNSGLAYIFCQSCFGISTSLTTILYIVPVFCPFLTPDKWALTNNTHFFREMFLFNLFFHGNGPWILDETDLSEFIAAFCLYAFISVAECDAGIFSNKPKKRDNNHLFLRTSIHGNAPHPESEPIEGAL
jgi:hypothetical protein